MYSWCLLGAHELLPLRSPVLHGGCLVPHAMAPNDFLLAPSCFPGGFPMFYGRTLLLTGRILVLPAKASWENFLALLTNSFIKKSAPELILVSLDPSRLDFRVAARAPGMAASY